MDFSYHTKVMFVCQHVDFEMIIIIPKVFNLYLVSNPLKIWTLPVLIFLKNVVKSRITKNDEIWYRIKVMLVVFVDFLNIFPDLFF